MRLLLTIREAILNWRGNRLARKARRLWARADRLRARLGIAPRITPSIDAADYGEVVNVPHFGEIK